MCHPEQRPHVIPRSASDEGSQLSPPADGFTGVPIDWHTPWLADLRPLGALLDAPDWRAALTREARSRRIVTGGGRPLAFVDGAAAGATAYESFIAATGEVPTRDNAHDQFNALVWLAWPRAKAALNARQAEVIAREGIGPRRGPVRDAATLIDESAVVLQCADPAFVTQALAAHEWHALMVAGRARWGRDIVARPFGHALLERLLRPFKGVTAAVVVVDAAVDPDAALADFVARADLAPPLLAHLPVLGIPGWCGANEDPAFYADARVFRPGRSAGP